MLVVKSVLFYFVVSLGKRAPIKLSTKVVNPARFSRLANMQTVSGVFDTSVVSANPKISRMQVFLYRMRWCILSMISNSGPTPLVAFLQADDESARLTGLLDSATDAILTIDSRQRTTSVNAGESLLDECRVLFHKRSAAEPA